MGVSEFGNTGCKFWAKMIQHLYSDVFVQLTLTRETIIECFKVQVAPSFCFQINFNSESMFFDHVRARINGPCGIFIALDLLKILGFYNMQSGLATK